MPQPATAQEQPQKPKREDEKTGSLDWPLYLALTGQNVIIEPMPSPPKP